MAWGLLYVHVIVLIPVVLSYHLRTSAILATFRLTFDSATPTRILGRCATAFHEAKEYDQLRQHVQLPICPLDVTPLLRSDGGLSCHTGVQRRKAG